MEPVAYHHLQELYQTPLCEIPPCGTLRKNQKDAIEEDLFHGRNRLLVIFGEIFAGKAHFAKEVINNLQSLFHTKKGLPVNHVTVRCLGITSWYELMLVLAQNLSVNQSSTEKAEFSVKLRIREVTSGTPELSLILLFTNFEDIVSQDTLIRKFNVFIKDILDVNTGVSVIVTSRVSVCLSHSHGAKPHKLLPLSEPECCHLLKPIWPYCETLEPIYQIVRRCHYRPALILRVRHVLERCDNVPTPEEVASAFITPEGVLEFFKNFPTPEGCLIQAIENHLCRLPSNLNLDITNLCDLSGSFGVEEGANKLKKRDVTEFKLKTMLPLQEHAILVMNNKQQLHTDPFIRAFVREDFCHVRHFDPSKLLFLDFLGSMLRLMRLEVSINSKGRALGLAQNNFQTLELTLAKAFDTVGVKTYEVYLEVVELEIDAMSAVNPKGAVQFFEEMTKAAKIYGNIRDNALLQGYWASSIIEHKGNEIGLAVDLIRDSLNILPPEDIYSRVIFTRRLGWMLIRLGDNKQAIKYLTKALALSRNVSLAMEGRVEPHRIQILSHLAIVNSYFSNFSETGRILQSAIPRAKLIMPGHPVVAVLLQTMGINLERRGYIDRALNWYRESGHERQKLIETLPSFLVTNFNNRAFLHLWRQEFDAALSLLERALNVRRKLGWLDYNTGVSLWYRGIAYLLRSQAEESVRSCNQAIEVFSRCSPTHTNNVHIRITLAHAYLALGRKQEAEVTLLDTLEYGQVFQQNISDKVYLTALEHLFLVRERKSDVEEIHKRLLHEAGRLIEVYRHSNTSILLQLQRKMTLWRVYFHMGRSDSERKRETDQVDLEGSRTKWELGEEEWREKDEEEAWSHMFTCQHCDVLGYTYLDWRLSKT